MIVQGKVHAVETYPSGTQVVANYSAGTTVLEVGSVLDLQETGGVVTILGTQYTYTLDPETALITLGTGLAVDVEDGEVVLAYPSSMEKRVYAYVDDGEDAVIATVPHSLQGDLDEGIREEDQRESVILEEVRGSWMVQNIVALDPLSDIRTRQALQDAAAALVAAAAAQGTANTALTSANGKNAVIHADYAPTTEANTVNDTWFVHAAAGEPNAGAIIGQYTGLGGTSWTATTISHQVISSVDLGTATVGKLSANYIDTGVLAAALTMTGYLLAGNPTGARVVIDTDGIRQYDAGGNIVVNIPTDPDVTATFEGLITANAITIKDYMSLQGLANEVARGAVLSVSGGTGAPLTAPSVAVAYPTYQQTRWTYLFVPSGHHGDVDDSGDMLGALTFFGYGKIMGRADKWWIGPEYTDIDGTKRTKYGNIGSATAIYVPAVGERVVIMSVYTTANGQTPTSKVSIIDPAPMNSSGTAEPTLKFQIGAKNDDYLFQIKLGRVLGPNGGTNYSDRIAMGLMNWNSTVYADGMITLRQYLCSDTSMAMIGGTEKVVSSPLASGEQLIGVTHGYTDKMGFPLGASSPYNAHQYLWLIHGSVKTYAYQVTPSMARLPEYDFPTPAGGARMNAWGNVQNNLFIGFRSTAWDAVGPVTKLTNNHWVAPTSSKVWVSSTNYDNDITGGTHESTQGPRASITLPKRAGLAITVPPYPVRPSPTTTDDPLAARAYIGRGNADPTRTGMERAGELVSPNRTLAVGDFTFPNPTASVPPPSTSNFPASAPGKIVSADGSSWVLAGDGKLTAAGVLFDGAFPGFTSAAMRQLENRGVAAGGQAITTVTAIASTVGGSQTFVAPPSGIVKIGWGALHKARADGSWIGYQPIVRTGSTIGSGTVTGGTFSTNEAILWFLAQIGPGFKEKFFTGLTPGATYNVQIEAASIDTTAGATLYRAETIITPVS